MKLQTLLILIKTLTILLPKFYAYGNSQNLVTTETLDEIIKNAGIDMTRFQVFPAYNGDSSNFANLRQIQIKGKLKPNEKLAFNINLQASGLTDQDLYNNSFNNIGAWLFDSNGNTASTATAYFRFANQVKSPADSDAKYLATYYIMVYIQLPLKMFKTSFLK